MLRARSRMLSFRPAPWVVSQVAEGPADLGEAFGGLAPAPDWLSQARAATRSAAAAREIRTLQGTGFAPDSER
jgi:hypothetical protein